MAISNTSLLIKRSTTTATPTSLKAGEIAYSYSSNNFFIGTPDGTGALPLGGFNTYTLVNNATAANTANAIVRRAADGSFFGQLFGNANTATALQTARNFSISGGDIAATTQSFDGTGAVVLNASLNAISGLTAGYYGGSSAGLTVIPVVQVAANGRVMSIANTSVTTSFNISDGTTSNTIYSGATLFHKGANGITTTVSANTVTFSTDTTVVRSNTAGSRQIITSDLQVTGNLTVQGNTQYLNTTSLNIADPLIYLAANNYTSDLVDIGFAGNYFDGTSSRHTGLFRHAADNKMYAFFNYTPEPGNSNIIDPTHASFRTANLVANIIDSKVSNLTSAIAIADGGTNNTSFTGNQLTFFNGTALASLANTGTAGTYANASHVPVITTDGYGRVSGVSNTQIAINASQITAGTLLYARGGTGSTSYTVGQLLVAGSTGLLSLANSTYTVTGTAAANNTVTSMTVDAYGRVTAKTYAAISGLTVPQGGTGASTFTSSGVIYGNGAGAMQVTALAGSGSDQTWSNQILTVTNAGVPVWASNMDGGTF
jgi:hypothetical protein